MILLEIIHKEKAIRATDLETHWTTYIAAENDEFLTDELDGEIDMIIVAASRQAAGGYYKKRILAAFPKSCTIVIYP